MTKTEYDILTYIQARGSCAWIDVLNHVRSNCDVDFQTIDATLNRCLLSHKWIKTTSVAKPPLCTIRLTPSGLIVLDIAKHEANKIDRIVKINNINVRKTNHGVHMDITATLRYGCDIFDVCKKAQTNIRNVIEALTSVNARRVHFQVKNLYVEK